jgi:hypothetical protein
VFVNSLLQIRFEYLSPGLTLRTLHFVHIIYVFLLGKKIATFSLYGINQLAFLMKCVLCAVRSESLYIMYVNTVPKLWHGSRAQSHVSHQEGLGSIPEHCVKFVVENVAKEQVFPPGTLFFSPVSTLQRVLHAHLHLPSALLRRTRGPSLEAFKIRALFQKSYSVGYKGTLAF